MNPVDGDFDPTKFGFPPPLTRKQGLARWAADHEIHEKYPNQYVAYIDVWNGEELDRRVLWTAATLEESVALRRSFDPTNQGQLTVLWVDEPDVIHSPSAFLDD